METDDDIFLIYKRAQVYIHKLKNTVRQTHEQHLERVNNMLHSHPPHGYTLEDWGKIASLYKLQVDASKRKGVCMTYKQCKDVIKELEQLEAYNDLDEAVEMFDTTAQTLIDTYKRSINNVIHTDFMAVTTSSKKNVSPEQLKLKDNLIRLFENLFGVDAVDHIITRKASGANCLAFTNALDKEDPCNSNGCNDMDDTNDEEWNGMVYNDINRINFNTKFKYDKRQHFKDTINQYQGLQHKNIPDHVISNIIDMIEKHGLADMSKSDPKERYSKLTKEHIQMFLSEIDQSQYYEDKQLIYSKITTIPCPNIQKLEKVLLQDFEQLVEAFLSFPEEVVDRKNFLNAHYVLRQLLRRRNVVVSEHDLNNLKTPNRLRQHDDIYQMCCEKLGWNFTPLG